MKVLIDATKCVADGACATTCPSLFELDEWGYARVIGSGTVPADIEDQARAAIKGCPEGAISADDQPWPR